MKIIVWGLPPIWGSPSPSPFVIKVLTWLRMAGIEHELAPLRAPPRSKTKKVPYVTLPNGEIVSDSTQIIARLSADHGVDLDAKLDEAQRARALLIQRTIEDHLYFAGVYERFATPEGFAYTRRDYFREMPAAIRWLVPWLVKRGAMKNLRGHGLGRQSPDAIFASARADIDALAVTLGDSPYFLGENATTIDATALGSLWALSSHPWKSPLRAAVEARPKLVSYVERMRSAYWSDWR